MTLQEAKEEIIKLVQEHDGDEKEARTAYFACLYLLDQVKEEPVGNPDKMTLKELAHELRRLFEFKYLTASPVNVSDNEIEVWDGRPDIMDGYKAWTSNKDAHCCMSFFACDMCVDLDLSEYADADGKIDYSRCIVEVE